MYITSTGNVKLLNNLCGKQSNFTIGTNGSCYLGLLTSTPTSDTWNGTEVQFLNTNNYARVEITDIMNVTYKSHALNETTETEHTMRIGNTEDINFNACVNPQDYEATTGADWGTITGWALFSSATGTTPYAWGVLTDSNGDATSVTVATQNTFHFYNGCFELWLEDAITLLSSASAST